MNIRKGDQRDVEAYISFLHEIKDRMCQCDWFFLDPDETSRELMAAGRMELWLAEEGARIAGVFSIIYPELEAFNLGYDLGLEDAQLRRVVHMDTAAVHPDYRGQGLQNKMMARAEKELTGRILLCTVHPENRYSLQNVRSQGYTIERKLEKYGSVRYILRKDL